MCSSFFFNVTATTEIYTLSLHDALPIYAPITAIFILFEMSDSYEIILPIMAAVVVSTLVAHWINPESVYTAKLLQKGIEITKKDKSNILQSMVIKDVMIRKVQAIPETMTMEELRKKVGTTLHTSLPVVNGENDLVGIVTYKEIHLGIEDPTPDNELLARDFMLADPVKIGRASCRERV